MIALLLAHAACRQGFTPLQGDGRHDTLFSPDATSDGVMRDAAMDAMPDADLRVFGPGRWIPTPAAPAPPRLWTSGVWTGAEFIVVGGAIDTPGYNPTATGAAFNPISKQWRATATTNALNTHSSLTIWSGSEVLAYGGAVQYSAVGGGARYNPATDTWTPMATTGQPGARMYAAHAWTGTHWLIWGGWGNGHANTGAIYDPATDTWRAMSTVGAPSARSFPEGVWTGTELIVWGGCDGAMGACPGVKNDGAAYNPATDSWRPISNVGAPSARSGHAAVWTGTEMIVWGGATGGSFTPAVNDGARYNPTTDTWRSITPVGAPTPRAAFGSGWLVDKMVVWGTSANGGLYDPVADTWAPLQTLGSPTARQRFAFAAGDRKIFVWGGVPLDGAGAVWEP